ncbi:MAG TPA: hypothetical protein VMY80_07970, partial [Anaerolineae bacterium]|nr:hypothetical protein [Anaerolineae bacterium]
MLFESALDSAAAVPGKKETTAGQPDATEVSQQAAILVSCGLAGIEQSIESGLLGLGEAFQTE